MKKLKLLILFYLFSLTNAWSQENFEDKVDAMILRGTIYLNQYDYPYLESLLKADLEDANEDQEVIKEEQEKDLTYYLKNEKNAPNGTLKLSVSAIKYAYGSILAGALLEASLDILVKMDFQIQLEPALLYQFLDPHFTLSGRTTVQKTLRRRWKSFLMSSLEKLSRPQNIFHYTTVPP